VDKNVIGIACDHAGFLLKESLKRKLETEGYIVHDFGTWSEDSCDYPEFAHSLAKSVKNGESNVGFSICGSGNGITMTVNKHAGVRGALCWNEEIAKLARLHNDANICGLPARFLTKNEAFEIVNTFLNTEFEGGRHLIRVKKIDL
jgi:ribose 5-phosphate isomerase B